MKAAMSSSNVKSSADVAVSSFSPELRLGPINGESAFEPLRGRGRQLLFKTASSLILTAVLLLAATTFCRAAPKAPYDYLAGEDLTRKSSDGSEVIRAFAQKGVPHYQFLRGFMYLSGKGEPVNYIEAANWFRKAAKQGDRDASYFLGLIYHQGLGVAKDASNAVQWYRKAAYQGHAAAQETIATMYAKGLGVGRDETIAMRWFYRAAQQGVVEAQINLAKIFSSGSGTAKNDMLAYEWGSIAEARAARRADRNEAARILDSAGAGISADAVIEAQRTALEWRPEPEAWLSDWPLASYEHDGTQASLALQGSQLVAQWRSLHQPIIKFDRVSATARGRPLPKAQIQPYAAKTSILLLFDASGPAGASQLQQEKDIMLRAASRVTPRHEIDVAAYADKLQLLEVEDRSIESLTSAVTQVSVLSPRANLGSALKGALQVPSLGPTERHGIFVFTDGHLDDALDAPTLIGMSKESGTSITFVIVNGDRPINPGPLIELAHATGGIVVNKSDLPSFLSDPFSILDSGGSASFPMLLSERLFWRPDPEINVDLHGSTDVELIASIPLPVADAGQTARYVLKFYPIVVTGSGTSLVAVAAALAFLGYRKRKGRRNALDAAAEPKPLPVVAVLEDVASGTVYPIQGPIVRLGRDGSNDIVLSDDTVSRVHAILEQGDFDSFSIENRSSVNGTFVNHQRIEKDSLSDGDLITIGDRTLRFSRINIPAIGTVRDKGHPST